jgi:hypothetical protein
MSRRTPSRTAELAVLAATLFLLVPGCKDDSSPTGPTPVANNGTTAVDGAIQVRGTERIVWNQNGDFARLRFRAYVDDRRVELEASTCKAGNPEAECSAPLPPLTAGLHTLALANVSALGVESTRSAPITLQKVAGASVSSLSLAWARSGAVRLAPTLTLDDSLTFTADIVATGVRAPAQLTALPDGRLLLSDATGQVRVVRPGEPEDRAPALDVAMLTSISEAPMGLASHPDFARNRFVYASLLERDRADRLRLRIVRLREVADTLGEAATLFEAPVVADGTVQPAGPRMAFGPDRLLYLMLPPGMEFVDEPAASVPRASMLRLTDEGRAAGEPLSDVTSAPLAFTWHPTTGALWMMFRGAGGVAAVRSLGGRDRVSTMRAQAPALRIREAGDATGGRLLLQSAPDDLLVAQALLATRADGSKGLARLALPLQAADGGMADSVGDVVAGEGGTLFVATSNGLSGAGIASDASDVVVRLTPVPAR